MSGLGTTMSPTGESGSVNRLDAQLEAIPSNPASLAQDTSIETVDHVMKRDWIWKETVTVSTTMAPGTVFAIFPIHPFECNRFVKHVGEMFNCWTGGMLLRMRMMATAFYGGSIRVGYLPPNMTKNQIRNMSLDVLTVFPNDDFDPKNTTWTHFATPDERDVAYHYISNNPSGWDENDKRSFGGYIVLYVAGRLVTQSPELSSINIIIESAGNFNFTQINPRFGTIDFADDNSSLIESARDPWNWIPCEFPTKGYNVLTILPVEYNKLLSGGFKLKPLAGTIESAEGIHIDSAMLPFRNLSYANEYFSQQTMLSNLNGTPTKTVRTPIGYIGTVFIEDMQAVTNKTLAETNWQYTLDRTNAGILNGLNVDFGYQMSSTNTIEPTSNPSFTRNMLTFPTGLTPTKIAPLMNASVYGSSFQPNSAGESIVVILDLLFPVPSLQPAQFEFAPNADPFMSEIYALRDVNGSIITYIRINPNGIMTVPASVAPVTIVLTPGMKFEFVQHLPITSPLPTSSSTRRHMKNLKLKQLIKDSPNMSNAELINCVLDY